MKDIYFIYDYDGTLTRNPMPQLSVINNCGYTNEEFNEYIIKYKEEYGYYEGWYKALLNIIEKKYKEFSDIDISYGAKDVLYNDGVIEFLRDFKIDGYNIKHYIISSGIKAYLENTTVAQYMEDIYATTFIYEDNKIVGINKLSSSNQKVDYIKQIINSNNCNCKDIIYFGDGLTDLDAFKFIHDNGGTNILVYTGNKIISNKFLECTDINVKADFKLNSDLVKYIKNKLN